jgi:signal transduction histidine kinase/CheY-like chemotaxis protein
MPAFDLLVELTARLASTARLDEIVDAVVPGIVQLGFGTLWIAVLDEPTGMLTTLKAISEGFDGTRDVPKIYSLDLRQPVGRAFREGRIVNITDPSVVVPFETDDDSIPPGKMAVPRAAYDHLRGRPFAIGPLLGSRGQPVGALGLAPNRGDAPIPDEMFEQGLLRQFMNHLGIAMERALHVEQLDANLTKAREAIVNDARLKAIGELAISVAHDLNNLSVVALLAAGVGLRSPADAADVLPRIERANRAMGALVTRLQRVARPSAEIADLQQTVDDILIMTKPTLRERSIEVDADLPELPRVRCDAVLLHQVILNLLINACDALGEVALDRRRIKIRLQRDGDTVKLTVTDSGPGIAPAMLAQLFQPFNTTKSSGHLGLGLAAARASLQQFGAQIAGRNAPSGGAVFEVTLGVAANAPDRPAPAEPAPLAGGARSAKLLAVDDDPDVVYFIREYLEPLGYEVETVTDSDKAIEIARARPFDLVLCDFGMPRHSGLEVCQRLRAGGFPGKLVLMTGWDTYSLTTEQLSAHCDTLLKKPFLGAELVRAIETVLSAQAAGPPGAAGAPGAPPQ